MRYDINMAGEGFLKAKFYALFIFSYYMEVCIISFQTKPRHVLAMFKVSCVG